MYAEVYEIQTFQNVYSDTLMLTQIHMNKVYKIQTFQNVYSDT